MSDVFVIGIAGGSGSGKSTLTRKISENFGDKVTVIRHDDYYKAHDGMSYEERAQINYDHPDAYETELMIEQLTKLRNGESVISPVYDFTVHNRSEETREITPSKIIIVEGILILANERLCDLFDLKIYVDTDADIRLSRRIIRDVKKRARTLDSVVEQYFATVKPMHEKFVEPSKKKADIIVPNGGKNPVVLDMVFETIKKYI